MIKLLNGRESLISEAHHHLADIKKDGDVNQVAFFDCFVDRLEFHEKYEKEKVDYYHKYWRKLIIATPILASIATIMSCYIVGQDFATEAINWISFNEHILSVSVALLEFIVTLWSALIGAVLPAKQFSEAASNLIKLDELLFNTVVEIGNEKSFPKEEGQNSKRAAFWLKKYKQLSDIGLSMIAEDFVHRHKKDAHEHEHEHER